VALDLILDCEPGSFTLLGDRLDEGGEIVEPIRIPWQPGGALVTPPGKWQVGTSEDVACL
jgi:hypothetical protein